MYFRLAPYMQPGMAGPSDTVLVARAWPAGLGACSKVHRLLRRGPLKVDLRFIHISICVMQIHFLLNEHVAQIGINVPFVSQGTQCYERF
jgi:hypothetical protein